MDVTKILAPDSVRCEPAVTSKKHALEMLSEMLAKAAASANPGKVLDGLAARERLGSTCLGEAVAMPHTRVAGIEQAVGAFLRLSEPVEFDAPDGKPVDMLFGLLVPEGSTTGEMQQIRQLVKKLREPALQRQLRAASEPEKLYEILTDALAVIQGPPAATKTGGR
jgi:PTS system nitrogen regulatory IIA component